MFDISNLWGILCVPIDVLISLPIHDAVSIGSWKSLHSFLNSNRLSEFRGFVWVNFKLIDHANSERWYESSWGTVPWCIWKWLLCQWMDCQSHASCFCCWQIVTDVHEEFYSKTCNFAWFIDDLFSAFYRSGWTYRYMVRIVHIWRCLSWKHWICNNYHIVDQCTMWSP